MKPLTAFWWAPDHQPTEGQTAEFHLKPLNLWQRMDLELAVRETGVPNAAAVRAIFEQNVIGWRGTGLDYSPAKKVEIGHAADSDWMLWLFQVAGHLLREARLSEAERGN